METRWPSGRRTPVPLNHRYKNQRLLHYTSLVKLLPHFTLYSQIFRPLRVLDSDLRPRDVEGREGNRVLTSSVPKTSPLLPPPYWDSGAEPELPPWCRDPFGALGLCSRRRLTNPFDSVSYLFTERPEVNCLGTPSPGTQTGGRFGTESKVGKRDTGGFTTPPSNDRNSPLRPHSLHWGPPLIGFNRHSYSFPTTREEMRTSIYKLVLLLLLLLLELLHGHRVRYWARGESLPPSPPPLFLVTSLPLYFFQSLPPSLPPTRSTYLRTRSTSPTTQRGRDGPHRHIDPTFVLSCPRWNARD